MDKIESFSKELLELLEQGKIKDRDALGRTKNRLAEKHRLQGTPSNPTILSFSKNRNSKHLKFLMLKPTRSLSGIAVVAVMTKPHKCPGKCIYCPGSLLEGKDLPKSYTGMEPAAMRAVSADFNPTTQAKSRLKQLYETGHSTEKIELVVMGGTFLSQPAKFQEKFMVSCINAITGSRARKIDSARDAALTSERRITGITFETRPDYCGKKEINSMLGFGGTRCELGVQTISDRVYKLIKRGHSVKDVVNATALLKDSAFKVTYHFMPGLPGTSLDQDIDSLRELFSNPDFKPDSLKLYPCLVMPNTKLFRDWRAGRFEPIDTAQAIELVLKLKKFVPYWARIMRIQRDIPSTVVSAGVDRTNLRQMAQFEAEKRGIKCSCIRCREVGLRLRNSKSKSPGAPKEFVEGYDASGGTEKFISFEDKQRENLFGFLRMRFPNTPFRKEISRDTAIVRELRVFGKALPLGKHEFNEIQHSGFGKRLLQMAEEIAVDEFNAKKLLVISSLGTKQYYFSQGFERDGVFVSKPLN